MIHDPQTVKLIDDTSKQFKSDIFIEFLQFLKELKDQARNKILFRRAFSHQQTQPKNLNILRWGKSLGKH